MVGFAVGGFLLARQPELLAEIEDRIRTSVSGNFGKQLVKLMNSAIASRGSVGLIGLAGSAWAGLNWMANLREALTAMWAEQAASRGSSGPSCPIWWRWCRRLWRSPPPSR
ncbi:virulence factor BrkB family protein [Mycobacterium xenopi 3993]|nr:virulence factor BrkB family protein [Mycobacterium xenopi 3993]